MDNPSVIAQVRCQLPYEGEPWQLSLPFRGEVSAYADGGVFY